MTKSQKITVIVLASVAVASVILAMIFCTLSVALTGASLFGAEILPTDDAEFIEDMKLPSYKAGEVITLNVYNWGEYISDGSDDSLDVNRAFEEYFNENLSEKYGGIKVKVSYSTYATNEDMYSKLKNSAVSYDVITPSDYMIEKMKDEGMLLPFDTSTLSNYSNIIDSFKNAYYDKDNCYSVPYTWGMMGIIYNKTMVDAADVAEKSWGLLWNEKYAGNILQFNNPRDAFATAMFLKGLDINSEEDAVWDEALELLKEQKPLLQGYVNDEIFNKMKSESAAIAPYFVGDFLTMAEEEPNLDFYYPKEGVNYFVDAMCIPTSSANPHIAKEYINFMASEEVAIANATYLGYASPNKAVIESDEYIEAMSEYAYEGEDGKGAYELLYEYDPADVNRAYAEKLGKDTSCACYNSFTPNVQNRVNTLWEELKITGSTELWVHISAIAIVVLVLGYAGYDFYIKKKRSRHYRKKKKAL